MLSGLLTTLSYNNGARVYNEMTSYQYDLLLKFQRIYFISINLQIFNVLFTAGIAEFNLYF